MKICNLEVQTVKKNIKNIHLGVYPPLGRIRVAAPTKTDDETIRLFLISKISWIRKQCSKFAKQQRQTKREYVSGESHFFLGNRYRLNVVHTDRNPMVEITRKTHIDLHINPNTNVEKREEILNKFYRRELKNHLPALVEKWQKITGAKINEVHVKKMKTKWGTSNPKERRIWLNLELAKNNLRCTEYVLAHEMTHLIEKKHTDKFHRLMDLFMPQWQQHKNELNHTVLGYFEWNQ